MPHSADKHPKLHRNRKTPSYKSRIDRNQTNTRPDRPQPPPYCLLIMSPQETGGKMASTSGYNLWDNRRYSIANFNFNLTVISVVAVKYSFSQAGEILPKINHRCKKTFFTFFNVFYFFPRFLFSRNVVKEARRGRIFKFHGLTKAYAQLQHLLAIRCSEGQDDWPGRNSQSWEAALPPLITCSVPRPVPHPQ